MSSIHTWFNQCSSAKSSFKIHVVSLVASVVLFSLTRFAHSIYIRYFWCVTLLNSSTCVAQILHMRKSWNIKNWLDWFDHAVDLKRFLINIYISQLYYDLLGWINYRTIIISFILGKNCRGTGTIAYETYMNRNTPLQVSANLRLSTSKMPLWTLPMVILLKWYTFKKYIHSPFAISFCIGPSYQIMDF